MHLQRFVHAGFLDLSEDINSGSDGSHPYQLTTVGNTLYFSADDGTNGGELWKSDGTATGTVMVKDINTEVDCSSIPTTHSRWQHPLFPSRRRNQRIELWKSDGTANGTVMVKDINSGSEAVSPHLTAVGNTLYFQARRRNQRNRIVEERWNSQWHSDGQGYQQRKSSSSPYASQPLATPSISKPTTEPTDTNCGRATEQPMAQ